MTTVAILPISNVNGEKSYRAIAGEKHSVGKTVGQALDALTAQLDEIEFSALLVIQSFDIDAAREFVNPYYRAIAQRANHRCEYCKAPEVVFNFPFEVEHIIPLSQKDSND